VRPGNFYWIRARRFRSHAGVVFHGPHRRPVTQQLLAIAGFYQGEILWQKVIIAQGTGNTVF
jgi:hypothetical protein